MLVLVILILALQIVPLIKLCHVLARRVFSLKKTTCSVFQGVAKLEYVMFPLRRYLLTLPLVLLLLIQILSLAWTGLWFPVWLFTIFCAAVLVSFWAEYAKIFVDLDALELLKIFPSIHPNDFFKRYCLELAFGGTDFFDTRDLTRLKMFTANFRHEIRASKSGWISLKCLYDTYALAQMASSALRRLGQNYFDGVFDALAALWGKRMLERCRVYLTVTGADQLFDLEGRVVFIANHKSWFDFAVFSCAFSDVRFSHRRPRIRFVVSPQTARWQRLMFRWLGLSQLLTHIPVYTSSSDSQAQQKVITDGLEKDVDFLLFPQEGLTLSNVDRANKRRDAGFFATQISSQSGEHLQQKAAELVCRMLDSSTFSRQVQDRFRQQEEDLHVVFAALRGTANVLPANALCVQTEVEVNLNVGQVLILEPQALAQSELCLKLTQLFDRELQLALGVHQNLIQRYLTELKGQFRYDDEKIELIKDFLLSSVKKSDIIFKILDGTYALPVSSWNSYLSHLSQLLLERARVAQLEHLFDEVRQELIKVSRFLERSR